MAGKKATTKKRTSKKKTTAKTEPAVPAPRAAPLAISSAMLLRCHSAAEKKARSICLMYSADHGGAYRAVAENGYEFLFEPPAWAPRITKRPEE